MTPTFEASVSKFMKKAARLDPFELKAYADLLAILDSEPKYAEPQKLGLKLLLISDTHGYFAFDKYRFANFLDTVGDFDLCVILGDVHPYEMPYILDCVPSEMLVGVLGNHDHRSLYRDFGVREVTGEIFEAKGVRFAAIDGSFKYKNDDFVSHSQHESLLIAENMPKADVLLTHDTAFSYPYRESAHAGLVGINYYMHKNLPKWHFHGHVHDSYTAKYPCGTVEKSVYLCEYVEI